jgi:hypothetical protein
MEYGQPRSVDLEPSIGVALQRFAGAIERTALHRLDLLRLRTHEEIARLSSSATRWLVTCTLGVIGWVMFIAAGVIALRDRVPPEQTLALVGALHVLVALGLAAIARRGDPGVEDRS